MPWIGTLSGFLCIILDVQGVTICLGDSSAVSNARGILVVYIMPYGIVFIVLCSIAL